MKTCLTCGAKLLTCTALAPGVAAPALWCPACNEITVTCKDGIVTVQLKDKDCSCTGDKPERDGDLM